MRRRFQLAGLFTSIMLTLICVQPICASEKAIKEECMDKVNAAVALIQKEGPDASYKKIMDKSGPFIWKDSYVFCIGDKVGVTHAHPMSRLLGFPMKNFKDEEGKQPFVEVIEVANTKGHGWKSYYYSGGAEPKSRLKTIYFAKVPGENIIVGAGYYND